MRPTNVGRLSQQPDPGGFTVALVLMLVLAVQAVVTGASIAFVVWIVVTVLRHMGVLG